MKPLDEEREDIKRNIMLIVNNGGVGFDQY